MKSQTHSQGGRHSAHRRGLVGLPDSLISACGSGFHPEHEQVQVSRKSSIATEPTGTKPQRTRLSGKSLSWQEAEADEAGVALQELRRAVSACATACSYEFPIPIDLMLLDS